MKPTVCDVGAHIPQLLPHNQRRGREIFFLTSKKLFLELTPEEVLLYDSVDGRRTVDDLEKMHPGAGDRLLKWHNDRILELIPPITPPATPHLVVIEPHMDDAALGIGGLLLHRRGRCRITILSVVTWSNFTAYLKLDLANVRDITKLRQQESALVAKLLGAEQRCLDWTDAPLRFWPVERWSQVTVERFNATGHIFVDLFPRAEEVSLIANRLMHTLSVLAPDELWIPMGVVDHVDHRTTRSACLLMLAEAGDRFSKLPVFMYEDVPHSSSVGRAPQIRAALAECGTHLVRCTEDITDVLTEKVRVVSVYASQFELSKMELRIREIAGGEGDAGKFVETYHRVEGARGLPPESHLSPDWGSLATLQTETRSLLADRTKWRRLTLLALPSGHLGRWKTDTESLMAAFPNAVLKVYASEEVAWQAEEGLNHKLTLAVVRRWTGWLCAIGCELFRFRTPTIVLWSGAFVSGFKRKLLKALFPFRHVLFAPKLCDFCGLMNEELGNAIPSRPNRSVSSRPANTNSAAERLFLIFACLLEIVLE